MTRHICTFDEREHAKLAVKPYIFNEGLKLPDSGRNGIHQDGAPVVLGSRQVRTIIVANHVVDRKPDEHSFQSYKVAWADCKPRCEAIGWRSFEPRLQ